tara:strand:- start:1369 stop:1590 length:222 start_codon:yes stop_codon:yes gene_type:complete
MQERSVSKEWLKVSKETEPFSSWISNLLFAVFFFGYRVAVTNWIYLVFRPLPDEPDLAESENSSALKFIAIYF